MSAKFFPERHQISFQISYLVLGKESIFFNFKKSLKIPQFFSIDTVSVEKLWTQNTRIIHDVWRLLILSNEEKRMIMKILKKEWFIWNLKKRGVVEKTGEEETKSMPYAPVTVTGGPLNFNDLGFSLSSL
jgi:hypothetical protein